MKNRVTLFLFAALIGLSAFTTYQSITWKLDPTYQIKFTSENPEGIFKSLEGDINFDPSNLARSFFSMKVDVSSINTGRGMQNKHALSEKWFDVEKYPYITYKSKSFEVQGDGFEVTGMLTIKDVTKEVTFPFEFKENVFQGTFDVDRIEYHVGTMDGMSKNASQILTIDLIIPVSQ